MSSRNVDVGYRADLDRTHMRYIDTGLWEIIADSVPTSCKSTRAPCVLTHPTESETLANVQRYLNAVASDDLLVAFYVLDDYPGNIADLLARVRGLILASNRSAAWARPTICAFAAALDSRDSTGAWNRDRAWIDRAAINYSPQACDLVSVYAYTRTSTNPSTVDWSMGTLLPDVRRILAARGWNEATPLLGTPMAFSYPTRSSPWFGPNGDQLRTQTAAFCAGGASALLPYAWDDSYNGPKLVLRNDPDLRRGFAAGLQDCQAHWSRKSTS